MPKLDSHTNECVETYLPHADMMELMHSIADHSTSCPWCDGTLVYRSSGYATFYGCSNYGKKGINCTFKVTLRDYSRDLLLTRDELKALEEKGYLNIKWYETNVRLRIKLTDNPKQQGGQNAKVERKPNS